VRDGLFAGEGDKDGIITDETLLAHQSTLLIEGPKPKWNKQVEVVVVGE